MSTFPNGVYSKTTVAPTTTANSPSHAGQHNALSDEIVAIETVLGANPQGSAASVAARFTSAEAAIATNAAALVSKASTAHASTHSVAGSDQISISPSQISQSSATNGQALIWNGSTWIPTNVSATSVAPSQITQEGATNGQALIWNGSTWVPTNVVATSIAPGNITQGGATTNQALIWNGTAWAPANISATSIAPNQITQGGATTGQTLTWNGTAWTPTAFGQTSGVNNSTAQQVLKSDPVTLNGTSGTIWCAYTGGGNLAAGSGTSFTFYNSSITSDSIILFNILTHPSTPIGTTANVGNLFVQRGDTGPSQPAGSIQVTLRNLSGTVAWSNGYLIKFVIINAPSA